MNEIDNGFAIDGFSVSRNWSKSLLTTVHDRMVVDKSMVTFQLEQLTHTPESISSLERAYGVSNQLGSNDRTEGALAWLQFNLQDSTRGDEFLSLSKNFSGTQALLGGMQGISRLSKRSPLTFLSLDANFISALPWNFGCAFPDSNG
eukprot:2303897-Rhodomonas_salina.3